MINFTWLAFIWLNFSSLFATCQSTNATLEQQNPTVVSIATRAQADSKIPDNHYLVTKVSDGDTFWCINHKEEKIKIRLIGIDAPESRNVFKKKKQPFGKESAQYTTTLLLDQIIQLEFDVDSLDQFQRTLAYAYLEDGTFVNEKIIRDGFAILKTIAPNIKYENTFYKAQKRAREQKLGLWATPVTE